MQSEKNIKPAVSSNSVQSCYAQKSDCLRRCIFLNIMQLSETKTRSKSKMGHHVLKYIYTGKYSGVIANELIKHEHSRQHYRKKKWL